MKPQWQRLYNELLKKLEECRKNSLNQRVYIECCFLASSTAADKLMKDVLRERFENMEQEIYFFKTVKPKFKSRIEYYQLLYQAELFKPETSISYLKEFWTHELSKLPRFIRNNLPFYEYYKSGDCKYDHIYFVGFCAEDSSPCSKSLVSDYDETVATLIALEEYQEYVREQLKILN